MSLDGSSDGFGKGWSEEQVVQSVVGWVWAMALERGGCPRCLGCGRMGTAMDLERGGWRDKLLECRWMGIAMDLKGVVEGTHVDQGLVGWVA